MTPVSRARDRAATNPSPIRRTRWRRRVVAPLVLFALTVASGATDAREFSVQVAEDAVIHVAVAGRSPSPSTEALSRWVRRAGEALHRYLGGLPRPELYVSLVVQSGAGVYGGQALVADPPLVTVRLGEQTSLEQLEADWVLAHELAHTGLPDLAGSHLWFEEGFAGYVEAMARARAGQRARVATWRYLRDGIANGRPRGNAVALNGARSWGRVYWASVAFFLEADLAVRVASGYRTGLPDVAAAWRREGLVMGREGDIDALMRVAATVEGGHALVDLYRSLGVEGRAWQPQRLWSALGLLNPDGRFDPDRAGAHERLLPRR